MNRVYEYGCLDPIENLDWAYVQLANAFKFRNRLVEIEVARRQERDALLYSHDGDLPKVYAEREKIRKQNAKTHAEKLKRLDETANAAAKEAYAEAECYWGTKLHHMRAMSVSAKKCEEETQLCSQPLKYPTIPRTEDRFNNLGCLALQFPSPAGKPPFTAANVMDGRGNMVRLQTDYQHVPDRRAVQPDPQSRRQQRRRLVLMWMRIDSMPVFNGDKRGRPEPVWLKVPVILHRPLPPDAPISWVRLFHRTVGGRVCWRVQFTLEVPVRQVDAGRPVAGVWTGWEETADGGLLVARVVGSDGSRWSCELPARILGAFSKAANIRDVRSTAFDNARADLALWIQKANVPEWLHAATENINLWKYPQRLLDLMVFWEIRRFNGDTEMFERLMTWKRRERHLDLYEAGMRDQAMAWRRDIYRKFVRTICNRYGVVCVEREDLRPLARAMRSDTWARKMANVSSLRTMLKNEAGVFVEAQGENITVEELSAVASGACGEASSEGARDGAVTLVASRKRRSFGLASNRKKQAADGVLANTL